MSDVNFIRTNPASESYYRGRAAADQELQNQQRQDQITRQNLIENATLPSRLRQMNAQADLAQTQAQYAGPEAKARLAQTYAGTAQTQESTRQLHMQGFYKSIDLALSGQPAAAKQVAASLGYPVPDAVWNDAALLTALKNGSQYADKIYGNESAKHDEFMAGRYVPQIVAMKKAGQDITDPTLPYQIEGKPAPTSTAKLVDVPAGGTLVDATGKEIYQSPFKPMVVAPGATAIEPRTGQPIYQNTPTGFDQQTMTDMADQYLAGDKSVFQNLGRGAQAAENIIKLRTRVAERAREAGMSPAQIATKLAEFEGEKSGERTLGSRTANVGMAVNEAQRLMPLALQASAAVDRTQFPLLNSILLAGEKGVGSENVVRLGIATNSLINVYARAISPSGVPTVSDKDHARELLAQAWSQGQYAAGVNQLWQEMQAAQQSPRDTMQEFRENYGGTPQGGAPAPGAPQGASPGSARAIPPPPPGFHVVQ